MPCVFVNKRKLTGVFFFQLAGGIDDAEAAMPEEKGYAYGRIF